jgi:hypothetical protein
MHACRTVLALSLVSLLAACAADRPLRATPAEVLARPALEYSAGFRAPELEPAVSDGAAAAGTRTAEVEVLLLALDTAEARALEGEQTPGPRAWTTRRSELAPYLALAYAGDERLLHAPHILGAELRRNTFAVLVQHAYVADFELRGDATALVADPIVKTFTTGLEIQARAEFAPDERLALALTIRDCAQTGPLESRDVHLPGLPTPVELQSASLCTQRLSTETALAPDECLVLSWNDGQDLAVRRFALVSARPGRPLGTD